MVYDKVINGKLIRYLERREGYKENCDQVCEDVLKKEKEGKYTILYFHCYVTESDNNEYLIGRSFSRRDIQCSVQRTFMI